MLSTILCVHSAIMSKSADPDTNATVIHPPDAVKSLPSHWDFYPNRPLTRSGPYRDYMASISALIPKVATADPRNRAGPLGSRHASVTMLNLKEKAKPYCREFRDAHDLQTHFDQRRQMAKPSVSDTSTRRVYILENLSADYIAAFGGFFFMDPSFFVDHEQVEVWSKSHYGTRMTENLASSADTESSFCLPYFEMLYCKGPIEEFQNNCKTSGWHVGVTRINGKFEREVFVRRKCSFWSRTNEDGGWDGENSPQKI
jgi:hypothetical protein